MNAKTALIKSLLSGDILSIKTCFNTIGLTNLPREIGRMVERPFNVKVSRTQMTGKSRYGTPITWYEYRLNQTTYNQKGISEMAKYVMENNGNPPKGKITKTK
jgi:hypothetical protein